MATHTITVSGHDPLEITVDEYGTGRPFLLLHGGAGPQAMGGFAQTLAKRDNARVLVPTHPGFGGTPRPEWLNNMGGLAQLYRALIEQLDLHDVTVVGNSVGGWIAAELAILQSPHISSVILVGAGGIEVAGQPVVDIFSMTLDQITNLSYHNPDRFRIDPSRFSDAQRAGMAANRAALRTYGGPMSDATLSARLNAITVPTLVISGESDRIYTPDYGRAYAAAIPGARFELLPESGHMPQLESPEPLLKLVWDFATAHSTRRPTHR